MQTVTQRINLVHPNSEIDSLRPLTVITEVIHPAIGNLIVTAIIYPQSVTLDDDVPSYSEIPATATQPRIPPPPHLNVFNRLHAPLVTGNTDEPVQHARRRYALRNRGAIDGRRPRSSSTAASHIVSSSSDSSSSRQEAARGHGSIDRDRVRASNTVSSRIISASSNSPSSHPNIELPLDEATRVLANTTEQASDVGPSENDRHVIASE